MEFNEGLLSHLLSPLLPSSIVGRYPGILLEMRCWLHLYILLLLPKTIPKESMREDEKLYPSVKSLSKAGAGHMTEG